MTFGINGAELIILILLAVLILGPEKLPEYTRKLTEWIRNLRRMAEGAKTQFKEETGTDFDEIDWRKYDPRQYDPRRIIKEALADPGDEPDQSGSGTSDGTASSTRAGRAGLQGELDTVRSERDALREDLKDMDPRALFFGTSGSGRPPGRGVGSGTGTGTSVAGAAAGVTAAGGPSPAGADDPRGAAGEQAAVADTADSAADDKPLPAPFDVEAT